MNDVERKLTAARTRLILDKPFLGALVLRLPLIETSQPWCPTSATDARSLFYNPGYIDQLTLGQVQFVLAHEALHCGLSHFARRENRDRRRWDVACDYAVNALLVDDGLEQPPGTLYEDSFEGMTAEEIYPCIDEANAEEPMDQHLYDGVSSDQLNSAQELSPATDDQRIPKGDIESYSEDRKKAASEPTPSESESGESTGSVQSEISETHPNQTQADDTNSGNSVGEKEHLDTHSDVNPPRPLNEHERDNLDRQWQQRLAGAAQQAMQSGKLDGKIARLIEHLARPVISWRSLLARHMSSAARNDYDIMRPSQRREGDAILPSLHSRQVDVVVAIDTSGSIKQSELDAFVTEINAIKGSINARVTVLACDDAMDEECPWVFESWEPLRLPDKLQGGGKTSFIPVFEWIATHTVSPDLLVYFTDARGKFPAQRPGITTLWLVKGNTDVPWGQRISLN